MHFNSIVMWFFPPWVHFFFLSTLYLFTYLLLALSLFLFFLFVQISDFYVTNLTLLFGDYLLSVTS